MWPKAQRQSSARTGKQIVLPSYGPWGTPCSTAAGAEEIWGAPKMTAPCAGGAGVHGADGAGETFAVARAVDVSAK